MNITFQQIKTFIAVVDNGSIQAGAIYLHKTHPSVITALKKLECELGFSLFNRDGYRSVPTDQGRIFYQQCINVLNEVDDLKTLSNHFKENKETEISIAIGDTTPLAPVLSLLSEFTKDNKYTHLNLLFENLEGANERLLEDKADIIVHHIDQSDIRYEYRHFCKVKIIPVVANGFLNIPVNNNLKYEDLKKHTQCIIRSTAKNMTSENYFILKNAPHITVGDQHTKKEIILQRMAWGHMPDFLIRNELQSGNLLSIESDYIKSNILNIVVARLQKTNHGLVSEQLWDNLINAGY